MDPGLQLLPLLMMPFLHVGKRGAEHLFPFNVAQQNSRQPNTAVLQQSGVGALSNLFGVLHVCTMHVDEGNHLHL